MYLQHAFSQKRFRLSHGKLPLTHLGSFRPFLLQARLLIGHAHIISCHVMNLCFSFPDTALGATLRREAVEPSHASPNPGWTSRSEVVGPLEIGIDSLTQSVMQQHAELVPTQQAITSQGYAPTTHQHAVSPCKRERMLHSTGGQGLRMSHAHESKPTCSCVVSHWYGM